MGVSPQQQQEEEEQQQHEQQHHQLLQLQQKQHQHQHDQLLMLQQQQQQNQEQQQQNQEQQQQQRVYHPVRIARETYKHLNLRIQNVIHVPFVLMMMLYPTIIGFSLATRLAKFNLTMPTPHLNTTPPFAAELGSERDQWRTDNTANIFLLAWTFFVVVCIHLYLACYLVLKSPSGNPRMAPMVSWVALAALWTATTTFFLYYVSLSRYGPRTWEWGAAGGTSMLIMVVTGFMLKFPVPIYTVVSEVVGHN